MIIAFRSTCLSIRSRSPLSPRIILSKTLRKARLWAQNQQWPKNLSYNDFPRLWQIGVLTCYRYLCLHYSKIMKSQWRQDCGLRCSRQEPDISLHSAADRKLPPIERSLHQGHILSQVASDMLVLQLLADRGSSGMRWKSVVPWWEGERFRRCIFVR
jgi:hypothetical protein